METRLKSVDNLQQVKPGHGHADMKNADMENADMESADMENPDKHVKNSCMVDG